MKTTLHTENFKISITEIRPDYDNPTDFEISFESDFSPAYLRTTPYFIDATANYPTDIESFYSDINEFADNETYITYEFNVAHRHDNGLYFIIKHDRSGDIYHDAESIIFAFGQPVYDFIADTCRLLNVPFCTAS